MTEYGGVCLVRKYCKSGNLLIHKVLTVRDYEDNNLKNDIEMSSDDMVCYYMKSPCASEITKQVLLHYGALGNLIESNGEWIPKLNRDEVQKEWINEELSELESPIHINDKSNNLNCTDIIYGVRSVDIIDRIRYVRDIIGFGCISEPRFTLSKSTKLFMEFLDHTYIYDEKCTQLLDKASIQNDFKVYIQNYTNGEYIFNQVKCQFWALIDYKYDRPNRLTTPICLKKKS
jgi:hypothetical protein